MAMDGKKVLYGLANWALLAAGMVNLVVGTVAAVRDSGVIAATSLTAGLVLLLAATIERFESLKGLGVEATTRKLNEKIDEAETTLRKVRALGELVSASLMDLTSRMGRWDSAPSPRHTIEVAAAVRRNMMDLGSDRQVISAALRPWATMMCRDIYVGFYEALRKAVADEMAQSNTKRLAAGINDVNDPRYAQYDADIQKAMHYMEVRLVEALQFTVDDYPSRFMSLFDDVPLVDPERIRVLRESAEKFVPGMESLRRDAELPEGADLWIETIEARREHRA